jgi:hypothetical protein
LLDVRERHHAELERLAQRSPELGLAKPTNTTATRM